MRIKIAAIAAVSALSLALTGCGKSDSGDAKEPAVESKVSFEAGTTMETLNKAGSIKIGVKFDQPGLGYKDPAKGDTPEGFDISMGKIVAGKLGIPADKIEWVETVSKNRETGAFMPHDMKTFKLGIEVNLVGTFRMIAASAAGMAGLEPATADGGRGVIVNTASVAAFEGQVGQAAYAASKGGVHSLTIAAARDLAGQGIRVNTIAPGIVETPMLARVSEEFREGLAAGVPFPPRLGRPQEFAQLVTAFIDNDYLNGTTVRMDGALRMAPR